jgi:hypothetical protein
MNPIVYMTGVMVVYAVNADRFSPFIMMMNSITCMTGMAAVCAVNAENINPGTEADTIGTAVPAVFAKKQEMKGTSLTLNVFVRSVEK